MNMEEYYCFAHLYDSMLLNSNGYERKIAIFSRWQLHPPAYIIGFALAGVFHHGVFNQWDMTNALTALIGYLREPTFSDWCKHQPILIHLLAAVQFLFRQLLTG